MTTALNNPNTPQATQSKMDATSLNLDREVLYAAMATGNWRFTKSMPQTYFNDEYNAELEAEWQVERLAPPFCLNKGPSNRMWVGDGPAKALLNAVLALATEGFNLEPEVEACFEADLHATLELEVAKEVGTVPEVESPPLRLRDIRQPHTVVVTMTPAEIKEAQDILDKVLDLAQTPEYQQLAEAKVVDEKERLALIERQQEKCPAKTPVYEKPVPPKDMPYFC